MKQIIMFPEIENDRPGSWKKYREIEKPIREKRERKLEARKRRSQFRIVSSATNQGDCDE